MSNEVSTTIYIVRLALRCLRTSSPAGTSIPKSRSFANTTSRYDELAVQSPPAPTELDPALVSTRKEERQLIKLGIQPIGSRRRRAALQSSDNIPFEQLPYQCFQEARKILVTDRVEKLKQIEVERKRIAKIQSLDPAQCGGEVSKKGRLVAMYKYLEKLKIYADLNDPVIKKRFEDGDGDMNRPIYRYLADRQWREYKRVLLMQRITQMNVVPDILPYLDPTAEVSVSFSRRHVQPGEFVDSRVSERPARLNVQVFDKGERLVSVAVIDADVPNIETDRFDYRCHFLATNIPLSPAATSLPLSKLSKDTQTVLPWLPPYAQKGSPYHRLSIFILQQPEGKSLDITSLREKTTRDGFNLRSFNDRYLLKPVGVNMFRSIWDDGTAGVMKRAGIEGANMEFKRGKPEKLPYKKKDGARYR